MASKDKAVMGGFVIGGLLLFAVGLFLIGDRRMLFAKSSDYYSEFLKVNGLEIGAKVQVAGMDAGEVIDIRVPDGPGSKFRVEFKILDKLHPVVRVDSVASIQTDGLLGNKYLGIGSGTVASPLAPAGGTIRGREAFEMSDLMDQIAQTVKGMDSTVDSVKTNVMEATHEIADSAKHVDAIIAGSQSDIKNITAAVARITDNAGTIMAKVNDGQGSIGKFVNDDALYNTFANDAKEFEKAITEVRESSTNVKELIVRFKDGTLPADLERTVKNVADSTERLKIMVSTFQPSKEGDPGMMDDVRATLGSTRAVMSDLSENLEALKRSYFFRGFFKNRGFYDLNSLSPVEYQSKEFDKQVHKERVWVQQATLFTLKADGSEEISAQGKLKLDLAMADFLRFTKDRAVIVEGYSATGSEDEQYLLSRERALKVSSYITKKFSLSPEYVGVMPMGGVARTSTPGGGFEDGVALVLLKK